VHALDARDRGLAAAVDGILDACEVERYYFLEGSVLPYARHSPLNLYPYTRIEQIGRAHPIFFAKSFERLAQAKIILLAAPYKPAVHPGSMQEECLGKSVQTFLAARFTKTPWSCARGIALPQGYTVLMRKNPRDASGVVFASDACLER
jgi:hypothetical protein